MGMFDYIQYRNQEYQTKCREQHARSSATLDMAKKDHKNAIDRLAQAMMIKEK